MARLRMAHGTVRVRRASEVVDAQTPGGNDLTRQHVLVALQARVTPYRSPGAVEINATDRRRYHAEHDIETCSNLAGRSRVAGGALHGSVPGDRQCIGLGRVASRASQRRVGSNAHGSQEDEHNGYHSRDYRGSAAILHLLRVFVGTGIRAAHRFRSSSSAATLPRRTKCNSPCVCCVPTDAFPMQSASAPRKRSALETMSNPPPPVARERGASLNKTRTIEVRWRPRRSRQPRCGTWCSSRRS
jgi:hypothetical protein